MIRALFVDSDPDLRTIVAIALQLDPTFAVETAGTASSALAMLRGHGGRFDVLLLGATTRDMDQAMVEAIRWLPTARSTPVVFLATRIGPDDRTQYRAMGAAGMIELPFDPPAFAQQVADLVRPSAK
jgi:two-component system, OmpR family, response regulator